MFFSSFLVLFEEKKIRGAMPKSTFPFSHTDPQKTHFSKKKFFGQKTHFFRKKKLLGKVKIFCSKAAKSTKNTMQKTDFKNFFWNQLFFENRKFENQKSATQKVFRPYNQIYKIKCPKTIPATFRRIGTNVPGKIRIDKGFDINPGTFV